MRIPILIITVFLSTALLMSCSQRRGAASSGSNTEAAKQFVDQLAQGEFAVAVGRFDPTMRAAMHGRALREAWEQVTAQMGTFKKQAGTKNGSVGGYEVVMVRCEFANGPLDAQIAFNGSGQISGLYFVASGDASEYQSSSQAASPPPKPAGITEQAVTVGSGEWALPGALTVPAGDGPFPAIVLVHGSGPNDRDETVFVNKPFRDLAYGLAKRGVAVLRYDKRTFVYKTRMASVTDLTPKEEVIDDAVAAANLLRKTQGIDAKRLFVAGHSLGGMLIPRIGQADGKLAGLIVLAGTARPLEDVIVEQTQYLASLNPSAQASAGVDKIRAQAGKIKTLTMDSAPILGATAKYWMYLRDYNPAQEATKLTQPMLILQGERDYQVTMKDFQVWQQALSSKPNVTFKSYATLNHLFIAGSGKPNPTEYSKTGHVAEEVIDDIADWVKAQR